MLCRLSPGRRNRNSGFTFAEILAALVFMAILIPVLIEGLSFANKVNVVAERKAIATRLGSNLLNELIVTDSWQNGTSSGDFGEEWTDYEWSFNQEPWELDTMTVLTMSVSYQVQGADYFVRLSTMADSTQEVVEETEVTQ
jgi:hypothetical protein